MDSTLESKEEEKIKQPNKEENMEVEFINIFIKSRNTKIYKVPKNITLEQLKQKILEREGIPKGERGLVYNGKNLYDPNETLEKFGIETDSNISLMLCVLGCICQKCSKDVCTFQHSVNILLNIWYYCRTRLLSKLIYVVPGRKL